MLVGQPGGGKSYEAVAYHVLPALAQGRKVITNLPLDIEAFRRIDSSYPDLIVLRHTNIEKEVQTSKWNLFHRNFDKHTVKQVFRPFASIEDYGDDWRHPETGSGVLYVIDECHLCLPRARPGTATSVEEWFSLHRHELADVLLITQSYGKVCKPICDMVQVLYRVKKATAFGASNSYIRKVQDGIGGEVVNTAIRKYEKKYFGLYKSHTKSSEAGQELAANDIVPFWKRWPMIGAALCLLVVVGMLLSGTSINPLKQAQVKSEEIAKQQRERGVILGAAASKEGQGGEFVPPPQIRMVSGVPVTVPLVVLDSKNTTVSQLSGKKATHPFDGLTLHIQAFIGTAAKWRYSFLAEQNGQPVANITQAHLEQSGYKVERLSECSAKITYEAYSFYAVCDSPRLSAVPTI